MNRKNKALLIVLFIVIIVVACFISYHFMHSNNSVDDKKEESIVDVALTKSGIINFIEDQHIIVDNMQFDISSINETYYVSDEIMITYAKKDAKQEWIPVIAIKLLHRDEKEIKIQSLMDSMTMEEKVAQMFMARCPIDNGVEMIDTYQLGGYILFDANILPFTNEQFIARNNEYQEHSKIPMLIGIDEEGGTVIRLSRYANYRDVPFKSPQDLYNEGGFDLIKSDTKEKAELLKSVGINVNFAPVADVSFDANDFIYERAFARSVEETSEYIKTVVAEMKSKQIGSVLKHFPGYGNNKDTHTGSSYDERPLTQFKNEDFKPFMAGIKAGADSILINHNVIKCVDDSVPASLSKAVHDILRNDLKFNGVIFTDDLIMEAITNQYGDEVSAVMAVNAGNDMLISSNFEVQINSVINAVHHNEISEERINESVKRILIWKYNLGLLSHTI